MAPIRIILHGKAANDSRLRTAVSALRKDGQIVEVRVTWEPGDAARLTGEAVAEAGRGKINCIVAGGGDGTINEVFATAHVAGLPDGCSLGIIPLGTANDFAHSAGVPTRDIAAALQIAASARPLRRPASIHCAAGYRRLLISGSQVRALVRPPTRSKT